MSLQDLEHILGTSENVALMLQQAKNIPLKIYTEKYKKRTQKYQEKQENIFLQNKESKISPQDIHEKNENISSMENHISYTQWKRQEWQEQQIKKRKSV